MYRNGLVFRIIGVLLLIGLIAAGGFMVYQTGIAQGVSQAPAVATAISQSAENGQAAPVPLMMHPFGYGYGPGYYSHMYGFNHFGFFPFGICGSIFFLFLFFGLMRMIFFRGMWHRSWGDHKHGSWAKDREGGVPPMFNEWHRRSHGEKPEDEGGKKQ